MRKKPLMRESAVAVDIIAAERAMEGLLMVESLSLVRQVRGRRALQSLTVLETSVPKRRAQTMPIRPQSPTERL